MYGEMWDDLQLQLDEVLQHFAIVAVSSQFVVNCACTVLEETNVAQRESTAQLENKSCVCSVVVEDFRVHLFSRRFSNFPSMVFKVLRLFGHSRRHKLV